MPAFSVSSGASDASGAPPSILRAVSLRVEADLALMSRAVGDGSRPRHAAEPARSAEPARVAELPRALLNLQRGLTGTRACAGSGYMDDPSALAAYFRYYWPVSYFQVSMAMEELRARGAFPRPAPAGGFRMLDIGSGPGPATAAIAAFLRAAGFGTAASGFAATLVDSSPAALSLAGRALRSLAIDPSESLRADLQSGDLPAGAAGPFDLAVACHATNELWADRADPADAVARRAGLLARVWDRLASGGILLVIEPAALATSRPALALRDRLLRDLPEARMLGPCTTSRPCPLLAAGPDRTCHSVWPWNPPAAVAALAAAAGLDRRCAKAAWFALGRAAHAGSRDASAGSHDASRVVSDPMLNKAGRVRYAICSDRGLAPYSAHRDDRAARAAGFFDLRRGDLCELSGFVPRGDASGTGVAASFGFAEGASIRRLAEIR